MNINSMSPTDLMAADLAKSGLTYSDMLTRVIDEATREATKARPETRGYVIPYFDINGKLTQYYRVKIIGSNISYLQISGSPNHVYFPKNFLETFAAAQYKICLMVEGEKKAAICCKMGIPAIGFGGVDSWVNRTIIIPKGSESKSVGNAMTIKLPSAHAPDEDLSVYAKGFTEVVDLGIRKKTHFIIAYDSDSVDGTTTQVQKAAAKLGYELRFRGIPIDRVRQLVVPAAFADKDGKATVEDVLTTPTPKGGQKILVGLIQDVLNKRVAFPRHPAIREHLSRQLQKPKLDRRTSQNVALALLTDLDTNGSRMYSPDDLQYYYFYDENKHLMQVKINGSNFSAGQESEFGRLLYSNYGISLSADMKLIQWLGSQYAAESPIDIVYPYRIIARPGRGEDVCRVQINNGQYAKVTGDPSSPLTIMSNGTESTLFESQDNHVDGIDPKELEFQFKKRQEETINNGGLAPFWWNDVISEVRLKNPGQHGKLLALLYYLSPYLLKWRGMQLPIEIIVGEAGSGKSTLCEIRLNILTGDPKLRNSPKDQKDFYAQLANCGGLTVTDNVQLTDKSLRQSMSDDLCRLVTELDPRIQMRKYYTEADERSVRVNSVFAYTSITMPFQNSDLLQRSVVMELTKTPQVMNDRVSVTFDSTWKDRKLNEYGGRTAWMAHQLHVLHLFFKKVSEKWDNNYRSLHRLVNFEQALMLMAEVFEGPGAGAWIPQYLADLVNKSITEADWAMEGLKAYAELQRQKYIHAASANPDRTKTIDPPTFTCRDIANWASSTEDFEQCYSFQSARNLAKYMTSHKYNIANICRIIEIGKDSNRLLYTVQPTQQDEEDIRNALRKKDKKQPIKS